MYLMGRTETVMPKTRNTLAAIVLALGATFLTGTPANAAMTSRDCQYVVSGWANVKVCVTVTYHQPTASKYEIDKIKVEAFDVSDTNRVEFGVILWDGSNATWDRNGTLNADNGWDKAYTPTDLRTGTNNSSVSCWGTAYFGPAGSQFFTVAAAL